MKSVKQTFVNWINENQLAFMVIAGAVGLPLILALVVSVVGLVASLFVLFGMSPIVALLVILIMIIGGLSGWALNVWLNKDE